MKIFLKRFNLLNVLKVCMCLYQTMLFLLLALLNNKQETNETEVDNWLWHLFDYTAETSLKCR